MTQQFPLFLASPQQSASAQHTASTGTSQAPSISSMGVAVAQLPQTPAPFSHQDLMAWIMAGSKLGQLPADGLARSHLHLDAAGLASELNAGRCGSPDHVVPQPASPASPLDHDWASAQQGATYYEAAEPPATPDLVPRDPAATATLKRKWTNSQSMPVAPR